MSQDAETAHAYRGIVTRAAVRSTNDAGATQTATVETHRHVDRSDVEILGQFGVSSRPPAGGEMVVLSVGGDQGDLVGLPVQAPGNRLGGLAEGETAVHNHKGDRIHFKADGTVEGKSSKRFTFKVKQTIIDWLVDRIVSRIGEGDSASRVIVRPDYVKLRRGAHWLVVTDAGIFCSVPPVVGPDPEPEV